MACPAYPTIRVADGRLTLPPGRRRRRRSWPPSPALTIHDLTIEPARLEEAFLEFYADDVVDGGALPAAAGPVPPAAARS